jgi:putative hydrolase of the HAD superfamily
LKPSFIWFDLGYTLLYMRREEAYGRVLEERGAAVPPETLERAFHVVDKLFMREYPNVFGHDPETFMPWFLGALNHRLGIRMDLCAVWAGMRKHRDSIAEYWLPFEGVPDALEDLCRRNLRLGVISNWDPSARSLLRRHGLEKFFEHIVISSEVGMEKPAPEIFELAMRLSGVGPAECLYVGDNYYVDTVGARKAGMDCLIVNRFGSLGVEEIRGQRMIRCVSELPAYLG